MTAVKGIIIVSDVVVNGGMAVHVFLQHDTMTPICI